ncbi:MAG: glycoside hydrolase family 5 protein [Methylocystis sp.]
MILRTFSASRFGFVLLGALLAASPALSEETVPETAFEALRRMGRGVNILGYDGVWKGEIDAPFRTSDFELIRRAGFDHVRINFFGLKFMDAQDRIDLAVLDRLDSVIDRATNAGLTPVLDQHDNRLCQESPAKCAVPLAAFWRQISARYAGTRPRLIFEILNEPGGAMSPALWNATLRAALDAIRASDPTRVVVVAALNAGDARDIEKLETPSADRNLIVTVHYYEPMAFTHQGAPWEKVFAATRDVTWGSPADRAKVVADLTVARDWALDHDRPVYLGEFGVYDKAPAASRAAWIGHVARTADRFGWSWAYWQFDHDFALFESAKRRWNRSLLDALIGGRGDPRE